MSTVSFVIDPFAHAFRKSFSRITAATRNNNDNTAKMDRALIIEAAFRDCARAALASMSVIHRKLFSRQQLIKPISSPASKSVVGSGTADDCGSAESSAVLLPVICPKFARQTL